ncbi:Crp/Fnr family transcriptional regulator [Streptomyces sp. NPDC001102]
MDKLFRGYRLSEEVHSAFAEAAWARVYPRDRVCIQGGHSLATERVFFIVDGCVREERGTGEVRLWTPVTMVGNWTGGRPVAPPLGVALSEATIVSVPAGEVRRLVFENPDLGFWLAHRAQQRYDKAEYVYSANRLGPVNRLARLLLSLSTPRTAYRMQADEGQTVVRLADGGVVDGPSQADLADALALGRATVEKAIGTLRDEGIIARHEAGKRQNRFYRILSRERLRSLAGPYPASAVMEWSDRSM